ncbi:MAG TPA: EAL domain-containing protein [Kineosporiaceae bacterium]|nr:EAL domain-containing protein [Kineosporiaceae bacterium]
MTADQVPPTAVTIAGIALLGALISVSRARAQLPAEKPVWRLIFLGVAIVAGSAIVTQAFTYPSAVGQLIFSGGCVLGCAVLYEALVCWNRARTRATDRTDSLNGLSAVLVTAALVNLAFVSGRRPQHGLAQWQFQAGVLACSMLLVLVGTTVCISVIGGLLHDHRLWLIGLMLSLLTGVQIEALLNGGAASAIDTPAWLICGGLIASGALIAPGAVTGTPHPAASRSTILGALFVQAVGVILLTVADPFEADHDLSVTGFALAGVIGASVRILRLVRDLGHLTQTRHQAMTDELTGIPNRRALLIAVDDALRNQRSTSLLIIDLDRFKEINDRYGHAAGDRLLRHAAEAFATQIPAGAFLSRLGGDEFAVLLTDADAVDPPEFARDLARAAAAPMRDLKGRILQVGSSIGIATVDRPGIDGGELLRRADAAMYQAKASGSGVQVYDCALDAAAKERLELLEDLRIALKDPALQDNQILVYFQPQLDVGTGRVVGAEALVRWRHGRLGLLSPEAFIGLAEQNGLMQSLTERVLRAATIQSASWRASGHRLRVSVNLSAAGLADRSLLELIDEFLAAGMPAEDLVLEVTETSLLKDPAQALAAMHRIAACGVGISIDDYGTGYCPLTYLHDLPATYLKIDRSFISRLTSDRRTAAIVAGTVELAHRLDIRLIAEGVEDDPTLAMVRDLGCDESQGYLHSRPLPAEAFRSWLAARSPVDQNPSQRVPSVATFASLGVHHRVRE